MGRIFQNTVSLSTYAGSPLSWPSDPFPGFLSSPDLIFLSSAGAGLDYRNLQSSFTKWLLVLFGGTTLAKLNKITI